MNKYLISKTVFVCHNRWIAYFMAVKLGIKNPLVIKRIEDKKISKSEFNTDLDSDSDSDSDFASDSDSDSDFASDSDSDSDFASDSDSDSDFASDSDSDLDSDQNQKPVIPSRH
jgi:hypothetical protein